MALHYQLSNEGTAGTQATKIRHSIRDWFWAVALIFYFDNSGCFDMEMEINKSFWKGSNGQNSLQSSHFAGYSTHLHVRLHHFSAAYSKAFQAHHGVEKDLVRSIDDKT